MPYGNGASIRIPFDPNEAFGEKEKHYVAGTIGKYPFRSLIDTDARPPLIAFGPASLRDREEMVMGAEVEVVLYPEGHLIGTIAPDIAEALKAEPEARAFFESVAPFYRNNVIRRIEEAKRPETRSKRIAEAVAQLKAGIKPN